MKLFLLLKVSPSKNVKNVDVVLEKVYMEHCPDPDSGLQYSWSGHNKSETADPDPGFSYMIRIRIFWAMKGNMRIRIFVDMSV